MPRALLPATLAVLALLSTSALGAPARFSPVPARAPGMAASPSVTVGGVAQPLTFHELLHVGDQPGDSPLPFGTLRDGQGRPGASPGRDPFTGLCNESDYNAVLQTGPAGTQLVTHFECARGATYRSSLVLEDGVPTVAATRYDGVLDGIGGIYNPCAGQVTPWGSMLSSEEYDPNARQWDPATGALLVPQQDGSLKPDRYYGRLAGAFPDLRDTWPYRYGWVPELRADGPAGALTGGKHYAMGRFSHEMALVLPDQRTVYLSDDGHMGVGWFLFVADEPGALDSGALYAAQWTADNTGGPIRWVPLGHTRDADIAPWVETPGAVGFSDLYTAADPGPDGRCPPGMARTDANGVAECLALAAPTAAVPQPALLASRLETRRAAALAGASVEFRKGEGVAHDPKRDRVYLALSQISGFMLAGAPVSQDTVKFEKNDCGGIFEGQLAPGQTDSTGAPIPSDHVMVDLRPALVGAPSSGGGCGLDGIANPDNIVFDPALDTLFIGEDTHRHDQALLWAWHPGDAPAVVYRAPLGAEVTGLHMTAPLGGHALSGQPGQRWLLVSVQHPNPPESGEAQPFDPAWRGQPHGAVPDDTRSFVGALGPFAAPAPQD